MSGNAAADWLATAPDGFQEFVDRLTWHTEVQWDVPDYVDDEAHTDDGRHVTTDLAIAEAFSSEETGQGDNPDQHRHHGLLIDLDVNAWLIPSSSGPGHGHLYVDLSVPAGDLWDFLDAAVRIGLVEEGYVSACKSRGMTSLRAPWIRKGEEPSTIRRRAEAQAQAILEDANRTAEGLEF